MTLLTNAFDAKGSANTWLEGLTTAVQNDINTALSLSLVIPHYAQRQAETYPSVRSWFRQTGGYDDRRKMWVDRFQLDLFVKSDDPLLPNDRLMTLLEFNLMTRMGFSSDRTGFHGFVDVKGYFANAGSPAHLQLARLETDPGGWDVIPQPDPQVTCKSRDFRLFYR